jgi:hypothetical protein
MKERRITDKKGAANHCVVTPRCIDNWRVDRGFPCLKIGKVTRFDLDEVDVWLEENREKPNPTGGNHEDS